MIKKKKKRESGKEKGIRENAEQKEKMKQVSNRVDFSRITKGKTEKAILSELAFTEGR